MFPKIVSNREPGVTLGSELKKEFGAYFTGLADRGRKLLLRNPRQVFTFMIVLILFSGVMAFTIMRRPAKLEVRPVVSKTQAEPCIGQIMAAAATIQSAWATEAQINDLLQKKTLDQNDSLILKQALLKLDILRSRVKDAQQPLIQKPPQTVRP